MWDGVTYVEPGRNPIISEGKLAARLVFTNAGPWPVGLKGWGVTKPGNTDKPDIDVQLWPGNTVAISANLIRAEVLDGVHHVLLNQGGPGRFAAIGWRVVA